jgi:hypothetical protein
VAPAAAPGRARLARAAAAGLALLAALWVGVDFIRVRLDHYHVVGDTVYELAAAARPAPPGEPILAVNLPSWLTPPERTFALGNHGVQFIPFYVGLDAVVFSVNDASHPVEAIQFHNIRPAMPYAYGMYGPSAGWDEVRAALAAAGDVYVTHYSPERATLRPAGRVTGLAAAAAPPLATFAEQVALSLAEHRLFGDAVELRLDWRLLAEVEADLSVFVHLYGPDGALVAQDDGYPLAGLSPFWLWEAGRAVRDVRRLVWPAEAPPGVYRVGVGIYDPASAVRLPARDAAGRPFPDDAAIVLEIGRP